MSVTSWHKNMWIATTLGRSKLRSNRPIILIEILLLLVIGVQLVPYEFFITTKIWYTNVCHVKICKYFESATCITKRFTNYEQNERDLWVYGLRMVLCYVILPNNYSCESPGLRAVSLLFENSREKRGEERNTSERLRAWNVKPRTTSSAGLRRRTKTRDCNGLKPGTQVTEKYYWSAHEVSFR